MEGNIIKNKARLSVKLFIVVWAVLIIHVLLKVTFNYWQPYVIPNETLGAISDFIDANKWLQAILNGIFYVFNGLVVILCGLQCWWFKNKKQSIIVMTIVVLSYLHIVFIKQSDLLTLLLNFAIPLIINYKKWLYVILTFIFSNVFLLLSLWLEGFINANDMNYAIRMFLQFDYYIMLLLNYFVFNLIRIRKER